MGKIPSNGHWTPKVHGYWQPCSVCRLKLDKGTGIVKTLDFCPCTRMIISINIIIASISDAWSSEVCTMRRWIMEQWIIFFCSYQHFSCAGIKLQLYLLTECVVVAESVVAMLWLVNGLRPISGVAEWSESGCHSSTLVWHWITTNVHHIWEV